MEQKALRASGLKFLNFQDTNAFLVLKVNSNPCHKLSIFPIVFQCERQLGEGNQLCEEHRRLQEDWIFHSHPLQLMELLLRDARGIYPEMFRVLKCQISRLSFCLKTIFFPPQVFYYLHQKDNQKLICQVGICNWLF